jgi:hypothetical protein
MKKSPSILDPLLEKVEEYGKSSMELVKLKLIDKISRLIAMVFADILLVIILFLLLSMLNIGISIYIGLLLGKIYLGFFFVAGFYAFIVLIIYMLFRKIMLKKMKNRVADFLLN